MIWHIEASDADVRKGIRNKRIRFGGNAKLKIFGMLNCKAGKQMKKQNRVFFASEKEAIALSFRPCGHCLRTEYKNW